MDFNNNPSIRPIDEKGYNSKNTETKQRAGFNPIKSLNNRVDDLEKIVNTYDESFNTKHIGTETLDVLNGGDVNITNLTVKETLCNENLMNLSPIESQNVVGYDDNGNLIPIHAVYDTGEPILTPQNAQFLGTDSDRRFVNRILYDYIVDSQDKFDDLMTLAKSEGVTYKNIAIVGGNGDGLNGEYEYTVDSDTDDTEFNGANIYSYQSPKINITLDDVDAVNIKVFNNIGNFEKIDIDLSGTIIGDTKITLFADSNIKDFTLTNSDDVSNIIIEDCKLENVVNTNYTIFNNCVLENCDTVQSSFDTCDSDNLYVSTSDSIATKYKFEDCSIHLDIRPSDETITVNMYISSLINTSLSCLDKKSAFKILKISVDECDLSSKIIGNNDSPNKTSYKIFTDIDVEVSPLDKNNAYISVNDTSKTPIYTTDTTITEDSVFYLDTSYDDSKKLTCVLTDYNKIGFKIYNDSNVYKDLSLKTTLSYEDAWSDYFKVLSLLKNKADKTYSNNVEVKMYIDKGESTGTILYSKDGGTTVYLDSECQNQVKKVLGSWVDYETGTQYEGYGYEYMPQGEVWGDKYKDLTFTKVLSAGSYNYTTFSLLEVELKDIDEYAVQITSTNGDYINVKDAYFIQKF